MAKWKDETSYTREERESGSAKPRTWELRIGTPEIRVIITRIHGIAEPLWFGRCYDLGVDTKQLDATDIDDAQDEFLNYLADRAKRWEKALRGAL